MNAIPATDRCEAFAECSARALSACPWRPVGIGGDHTASVRRVLRGQRSDVFRVRESSLEVYLPWFDAQWAAGHRNGTELWRQLKSKGFRGCLRVVTEWVTRRRKAEKVDGGALSGKLTRPALPNIDNHDRASTYAKGWDTFDMLRCLHHGSVRNEPRSRW